MRKTYERLIEEDSRILHRRVMDLRSSGLEDSIPIANSAHRYLMESFNARLAEFAERNDIYFEPIKLETAVA